MRNVLGAAAAILCALPLTALANGMPMQLSPPQMEFGGLVPLTDTGITLVSEELTIWPVSLRFGSFRARAQYRLNNPGEARRIQFGVPVYWSDNPQWVETPTNELFKQVDIRVNGKRERCTSISVAIPGADSAYRGWCAAELSIPPGSVELSLEYPGKGRPGVDYPLWPAGAWKGPVRYLSIRIEAGGALSNAMVVSPAGVRRERGALLWRLENVDLRQLREVFVSEASNQAQRFPGWERASATLSARASSHLAGQGRFTFEASNAVDSDEKTAWCEGVESDGQGQWLEVRLASAERPGWTCEIADATVLPGYALDEATYVANGRVRTARIESCSDPRRGVEVELVKDYRVNMGYDANVELPWSVERMALTAQQTEGTPVWVRPPPGTFGGEKDCLRLVIRDVISGTKFRDTCISEFTPRLYCHKGLVPTVNVPGR